MVTTFEIAVSYGQICIFQALLENPYNEWTEAHWGQGFTWRPVSVSFGVLEDAISCEATVRVQSEPEVALRPETIRAIQVPFSVGEEGRVAVGSILTETEVNVPPGKYCLVYEAGLNAEPSEENTELGEDSPEWSEMWCVLTFVPRDNTQAQILRHDEQLAPVLPLCMEAEPA